MNFIELFTEPISIGTLTLPLSIFSIISEFVLPSILIRIVLFILQKFLLFLINKAEMREEFKLRLIKTQKFVFRITFLLAILILASLLFGNEFVSIISAVISVFNDPFFSNGDLRISLLTLISTIPVFLIASWIGQSSRRLVNKAMERYMKASDSLRFSISSILGYLVMFLVVVTGLGFIGINLSSLVLFLGVLGIGIGFGLQNTVANFFAGLLIIIIRPIKENDYIRLESSGETIEGNIVRITLLHSVVNTLLNESIIIPNADITSRSVHNLSYDSNEVIVLVGVQVHYTSDIDRVETLLRELAEDCPEWNQKDPARVMIRQFASSGIEMGLFVHIKNARKRIEAAAWLRKAIWSCFRDNGITIPYPQVDVHYPAPKLESENRE